MQLRSSPARIEAGARLQPLSHFARAKTHVCSDLVMRNEAEGYVLVESLFAYTDEIVHFPSSQELTTR